MNLIQIVFADFTPKIGIRIVGFFMICINFNFAINVG